MTFNKWQAVRGTERRGGKKNGGLGNRDGEGKAKEMGGKSEMCYQVERKVYFKNKVIN